jgi:hypothetical protein
LPFKLVALVSIGFVLCGCASRHGPVPPPSNALVTDPLFEPILQQIFEKTRLPVLLPKKLPDVGQRGLALHAWVKYAAASEYQIVLSFRGPAGSPCSLDRGVEAADSHACRFGSLSAKGASKPTCKRGSSIALADGHYGCFVPPFVGAAVGDSEISWLHDRTMYSVAIKAGSEKDVTILANEVIRSSR